MSSRVSIPDEVIELAHPYAEVHECTEAEAVAALLKIGASRWGALHRYAGKEGAPPPRPKADAKPEKPARAKKKATRAKAKPGDRRLKGNRSGKAAGAAAAPEASAEPANPSPPSEVTPANAFETLVSPDDPFNDLDENFGEPPAGSDSVQATTP